MPSLFRRLFKNSRHHHLIDYLAVANGVISAIALFPQLFALLEGQPSDGLSQTSFFLIAFNSAVWLAYAVHRRAPPLVISSSLNFVASVGILILMI